MLIYLFSRKDVLDKIPNYDSFMFSKWNDELDKLPKELCELIKLSYENDMVFTEFNFMLCFNLKDSDIFNNSIMFIPDEKFKPQLDEIKDSYR